MAAVFGGCCGLSPMESLDERADAKAFSPILSLDSYMADWAYDHFKKDFKDRYASCARAFKSFPKRKNVDINVMWDSVKFTHSAPVDVSAEKSSPPSPQKGAAAECNGNEDAELKPSDGNRSPEAGFDPNNKMKSLHYETFAVKFENTTKEACNTTLSSERKVKSTYEVDIHSSIEINHNVKLSVEAGGEMGKVEGAYEFNKMLQQSKGEKTTKEMETTLHTDCPVNVLPERVTQAVFVTIYQNYDKTLKIESKFTGQLNVEMCERKKNGKNRYYDHTCIDVVKVFKELKSGQNSPLKRRFWIEGTKPDEVVCYESTATFTSSFGVDQNVRILNDPLPPKDVNVTHPSDVSL